MAYRNGTYIAFHAEGSSDPTESDMKYYRLMTAWCKKDGRNFYMNNSHDKASSVRDDSLPSTLRASLMERLRNSTNFVLIISESTKQDDDWIPEEIEAAIDKYELPVLAAYVGFSSILHPTTHRNLWPDALAERIDDGTAHVIHIPFKQIVLAHAINDFTHKNLPGGPLWIYKRETYQKWGLI